MANDLCPVCKNPGVRRQDGRLDQSGLTYLPTVVWRCAVCDYASYEAARHVRWLPVLAPVDARKAEPARAALVSTMAG